MELNDQAIQFFPAILQDNIKYLLLNSIGLSSLSFDEIDIIHNRDVDPFHFIFRIPYAGKNLNWDVLFNPSDMEFAPDFDFNDNQFLANADVEFIQKNVPSWNKWNVYRKSALRDLLNEYLVLYKKYQVDKLRSISVHSKFKRDFDLLTKKKSMPLKKFEVSVTDSYIDLLIRIDIDYTGIPVDINPNSNYKQMNESYINLKLSYTPSNKVTSSLVMSPCIELILGNDKTLNLPAKRDKTLPEYLEEIQLLLGNLIKTKISNDKNRKLFMCNIIIDNEKHIVNYDTLYLLNVRLVYVINENEYLIDIITDRDFPQKKPRIILHFNCNRIDCKTEISNLQWNANLEVEEMYNNIKNCLEQEVARAYLRHKH